MQLAKIHNANLAGTNVALVELLLGHLSHDTNVYSGEYMHMVVDRNAVLEPYH